MTNTPSEEEFPSKRFLVQHASTFGSLLTQWKHILFPIGQYQVRSNPRSNRTTKPCRRTYGRSSTNRIKFQITTGQNYARLHFVRNKDYPTSSGGGWRNGFLETRKSEAHHFLLRYYRYECVQIFVNTPELPTLPLFLINTFLISPSPNGIPSTMTLTATAAVTTTSNAATTTVDDEVGPVSSPFVYPIDSRVVVPLDVHPPPPKIFSS